MSHNAQRSTVELTSGSYSEQRCMLLNCVCHIALFRAKFAMLFSDLREKKHTNLLISRPICRQRSSQSLPTNTLMCSGAVPRTMKTSKKQVCASASVHFCGNFPCSCPRLLWGLTAWLLRVRPKSFVWNFLLISLLQQIPQCFQGC